MIKFSNVIKKYGDLAAVDNFSLNIPENGIYCLLGRNGAGKTTLMKLLAGHIGATAGTITVSGKTVSTSDMPESVNFIVSGSEQFNMKTAGLIDAAADLQDGFDRDFAKEMAKRFELDTNKKFKQLSFGMKTMLTAIITLSNKSKVILLDEPTLGFDAIMRDQFNTLILESYDANSRVLIVSTHLIDEIAKVIERLIIIDKGRLLLEAGIGDIDERAYTLTGTTAAVTPLLEGLNCIGKTTMGSVMAAHIYDKRIVPPPGVNLDRISLQDFFINLVGGNKS